MNSTSMDVPLNVMKILRDVDKDEDEAIIVRQALAFVNGPLQLCIAHDLTGLLGTAQISTHGKHWHCFYSPNFIEFVISLSTSFPLFYIASLSLFFSFSFSLSLYMLYVHILYLFPPFFCPSDFISLSNPFSWYLHITHYWHSLVAFYLTSLFNPDIYFFLFISPIYFIQVATVFWESLKPTNRSIIRELPGLFQVRSGCTTYRYRPAFMFLLEGKSGSRLIIFFLLFVVCFLCITFFLSWFFICIIDIVFIIILLIIIIILLYIITFTILITITIIIIIIVIIIFFTFDRVAVYTKVQDDNLINSI